MPANFRGFFIYLVVPMGLLFPPLSPIMGDVMRYAHLSPACGLFLNLSCVFIWWSRWGPFFHWDSVPNPVAPRGLPSFPYLLSQIPGPGRSSDDDFVARGGNMVFSGNFIAVTTFFITFGRCAMQDFHFLLLFLHIVVF